MLWWMDFFSVPLWGYSMEIWTSWSVSACCWCLAYRSYKLLLHCHSTLDFLTTVDSSSLWSRHLLWACVSTSSPRRLQGNLRVESANARKGRCWVWSTQSSLLCEFSLPKRGSFFFRVEGWAVICTYRQKFLLILLVSWFLMLGSSCSRSLCNYIWCELRPLAVLQWYQ